MKCLWTMVTFIPMQRLRKKCLTFAMPESFELVSTSFMCLVFDDVLLGWKYFANTCKKRCVRTHCIKHS